jgi:hypothetical protein
MKINGMLQAPNINPAQDTQNNMAVIDEKQLKAILFLGIKGDIKIKPESGNSVDMYA